MAESSCRSIRFFLKNLLHLDKLDLGGYLDFEDEIPDDHRGEVDIQWEDFNPSGQ
jgi:hypothetical protein